MMARNRWWGGPDDGLSHVWLALVRLRNHRPTGAYTLGRKLLVWKRVITSQPVTPAQGRHPSNLRDASSSSAPRILYRPVVTRQPGLTPFAPPEFVQAPLMPGRVVFHPRQQGT